jgi:dTDP-4-amino-4,6-dideoxygalactose transaminase
MKSDRLKAVVSPFFLRLMKIPFLDLKIQNSSLKSEILPLWEEALDSAGFIGGKHVDSLETEFAVACSVKHSVLVNSGTDALRFIFIALGLEEGDEVITVPNTFIATTESITQAGGKTVFVDIDPETYNMDAKNIEAAITPKTKGIVPVHLYGQPADMDSIMSIAKKHGLWVVEDACQAHFAEYKNRKVGSIGVAGAFSFYPGKNMGACGEGGAITTNDSKIAQCIRMIRDHGQAKKYYHDVEGYNGRCDALQAAALRVKLKHLPKWNESRRKNASKYSALLQGIDQIKLPVINEDCLPVHHLFVILVDKRDQIKEELEKVGVSTALHYPVPLHLQKAYSYLGIEEGRFPITEDCSKKLLSLPMFPELSEDEITYVVEKLIRIIKELKI